MCLADSEEVGELCGLLYSSNETSDTLLNKLYTLRWPMRRPVADSLTGIVRERKANTII